MVKPVNLTARQQLDAASFAFQLTEPLPLSRSRSN